ncbi:MAG: aldo/keto reductase [Ruthenibacterium sp.]
MQYKTLGRTGLCVSAIGLGGIPIQRITAAQVSPLLQQLSQQGVNFIDTARAYTVSEDYLGGALEATGLRGRFILATKTMSRTYDDMARDIDLSLKNLRTDHIDLYQLHNVRTDADFETAFSEHGALRALQDAVRAGKVLHIGGTAHSTACFEKLLSHPEIESVMFPYNIVENQGEALMERAAQQGVGVIAMKPLAGGNITNGALALRYILQNQSCTLAIPGMASAEEIAQNLAAAESTAPLTDGELAEIAEIRAALTGNFCRRCGYCAPCTAGIDIPGIFTLHGYLANYGLADWARQRYATQAAKASDCVQCGACETRCPYNLPIRDKLRCVAEAFGSVSTAN